MPEHGELMAINALELGVPGEIDIAYVETISINMGDCKGMEAA